jgi:methyl-accepting chemotaxis protein
MKTLRARFILVLLSLSAAVAVIVGGLQFMQFRGYIDRRIDENLRSAADYVRAGFPIRDVDWIFEEGLSESRSFQEVLEHLGVFASSHNIAYIYVLERPDDRIRFVFDTGFLEDGIDIGGIYEEPPDELDLVFNDGIPRFTAPYTDEFGTFISYLVPLDENAPERGVLGLDYDTSFVRGLVNRAIGTLVAGLLIGILMAVILSVFIARSLTRPIQLLSEGSRILAGGDLGQEIHLDRRDELGAMARSIDEIRTNFRATVSSVRDHLSKITATSEELAVSMTETRAVTDGLKTTIDRVGNDNERQSETLQSTVEVVNEIVRNINDLNETIIDQGANINESSASVEQMVGNIASIGKNVEHIEQQFAVLEQAGTNGLSRIELVQNHASEIGEQSQALIKTIAIISQIAHQTNLLAMNAAIEAAHAGIHGGGFAVVAGEIRSLAETSGEEAKTIKRSLQQMQRAVEHIVPATEEAASSFTTVKDQIDELSNRIAEVRHALEEQGIGSREIVSALGRMTDITANVQDSSRNMTDGSDLILRQTNELKEISDDVSQQIVQTVASSQEIGDAILRVEQAMESMQESLRFAISAFKE